MVNLRKLTLNCRHEKIEELDGSRVGSIAVKEC